MGDDINDLEILNKVILSGCPNDAVNEVLEVSNFISKNDGGCGCIREFCETITKFNKKKKISGLICIKFNSTRLPYKNFRRFGNTTLLDIKIKKLLSLYFLDEVIVNTESDFIISYIKNNFSNKKLKIVKRDVYYSTDNVENKEFCLNVVGNINSDIILYSPVTMPFIENKTYESMFDIYLNNHYDSIILSSDGKQGSGHNHESHKICFGASLIQKNDIIRYNDFIGITPYFIKTKGIERTDIDYPCEFNTALYHYYNFDSIYGSENKNSLDINTIYNMDTFSNLKLLSNIDENTNKIQNTQCEIIDVTIRDGGFDNKWNWKINEVKEMLKCASDTGITYFEIGYICNKNIVKQGDGLYRNISNEVIDEIVADVNPKCKISVLFDAWRYDTNKLLQKKDTNIDLIRVVTYIEDDKLMYAIEQCKKVKEKGYTVSLNIMCASYFNEDNLKNIKKRILENIDIFDYVYFADSYGSLQPKDVDYIFNFIKTIKNFKNSIKIGFHIHNNGQIGMANMIESLKHVDIIDGSYNGLGRGMGNIRLEDMILFLIIKEKYNLNIKSFLNYLEKNSKTKDEIKNTLLGFLNVHPYRIRDYSNNMNLFELYENLDKLTINKKYNYN